MSLILDALNRSRQDPDQVPGLATQHYVESDTGPDRRRQLLPWLGLVIALVVIALLIMDRGPQAIAPPVTNSVSVPVSPQPANPASPMPGEAHATTAAKNTSPRSIDSAKNSTASTPVATEITLIEDAPVTRKPVLGGNSAVADLYQRQATAVPESTPTKAVPATKSEKQVRPASTVAIVATPTPENTAADTQREEPIDIEKMILKARRDLENAALAEHPAPFIADLSRQTKDNIPTIFYERHDYSDNQAQSSVVLSGKKLKTGGSPVAGVKVEEILPDSVVLSYRGTQFRLRALNSWVNL